MHVDVEPEARSALVPTLILQPLVENAIRHGMSRRAPLAVTVRARLLSRRRLALEVIDDGAGLPPAGAKDGIGLANTRARLDQLFGTDHHFELANRAEGGAVATLVLPRRLERPDAASAAEAPGSGPAEAPAAETVPARSR